LNAFTAPLRERRITFEAEPEKVKSILAEGADYARSIAEKKMQEVRAKVGVA
jgi:tryptophanyl-tRNA synthetase